MSAELLREAAATLQEAIDEASDPGYQADSAPLCPQWTYTAVRHVERNMDIECPAHDDLDPDDECRRWGRYDGHLIALLGTVPAGQAIADWLVATAAFWVRMAWYADRTDQELDGADFEPATTVARAILGRSS